MRFALDAGGSIVSGSFARELWFAGGAIGKRFRRFSMSWVEVVGVVEDVRQNGVGEKAPGIVYWPVLRMDFQTLGWVGTYRRRARYQRLLFAAIAPATAGFLSEVQQAVWSVNAKSSFGVR